METLLALMAINSALLCDGITGSIKPMGLVSKEPNLLTIQKTSPSFPASCPGVRVPHSLQCVRTSEGPQVQHFCSQRSNPVNALVLAELLLKCFSDSRAHSPLRRALFEGLLSVHIVPNQAFPMLDMSSLSDIFCIA